MRLTDATVLCESIIHKFRKQHYHDQSNPHPKGLRAIQAAQRDASALLCALWRW